MADGTAADGAHRGQRAIAAGSTINISWTAATDNIGVARYNVHRGSTSGFTPSLATGSRSRPARATPTPALAPGTYFYKVTAEDAAGNIGPVSNTASATVARHHGAQHAGRADRHRRRRPGGAHLDRLDATTSASLRYNVHRAHDGGLHAQRGQPDRAAHRDELHRHRARRRHLLLQGHRRGRSRQHQPRVQRGDRQCVPTAPAVGLVAAYGFDAGIGTTVADQSGNGNNGTISERRSGRDCGQVRQRALASTALNDLVTVADAQQPRPHKRHDPRGLGAPTPLGQRWRTAIMKERPGQPTPTALYADRTPTGQGARGEHLQRRRPRRSRGTAPARRSTPGRTSPPPTTEPCSRLFVNGTQAGTAPRQRLDHHLHRRPQDRRQQRSGANGSTADIDEVRIYNRALHRDRDPGRHEHVDQRARHDAAERARHADRDRRPRPDRAQLGRRHGQRRRRPLQRPPLDDRRASRRRRATGSRSRPARATPTRASPPAPTTTRSPPRTRPATSARRATRRRRSSTADTTPPTVSITAPAAGRHRHRRCHASARTRPTTAPSPASSSGSTGRTSAPRTRPRPTRSRWDTFSAAERPAHPLRGRARRRRQHDDRRPSVAVTVSEHRRSPGLVGGVGVRRGQRLDDRRPVRPRQQRHARRTRPGSTAGKFNNALSFNGTNAWVIGARLGHARPDDRHDARGVGAADDHRQLAHRRAEGAGRRTSSTASTRTRARNSPGGRDRHRRERSGSLERHEPAAHRARGATSPRRTTARRCASTSTARRSRSLRPPARSDLDRRRSGSAATASGASGSAGTIDEVRVYNRALSAAEIQIDMNRSVTPDMTAPTIICAERPHPGRAGINVGSSPTVRSTSR